MDQIDIPPAAGQRVDLRHIPTFLLAGDSIDVTQTACTHLIRTPSDMAKAMGAWACDVDLIIPDSSAISTKENPQLYLHRAQHQSFLYMHPTYCAEGPGQSITPRNTS